jgi:alkanesulfonate monooxygenase SsuD/methylene tetrahydromethanopterin reductase-like flavin-dependent oxidoreductase (luciferase family)
VNIPNHHPLNLAASLARLDHMLDGRFILGISPGALPSDVDADRPAMFLEAINHLLAIWRGEAPCNLKGEFWIVSTARTHLPETGMGIIPRPRQPPRPPIVVTAFAPFSQGTAEAAARGWDPISANFRMPVWLKSHWQKYVEGCGRAGRGGRAGRAANPANWRIAKTICVAEDDATARRYATDPDSPYRCYYNSLFKKLKRRGALGVFKTRRDQPDDKVTLDDVCEQLIIHGSPQRGAGQVLALREQTGAFGTLLYAGMGWKDRELGRKTMILLAEKVRTLLQAARPPQVAA